MNAIMDGGVNSVPGNVFNTVSNVTTPQVSVCSVSQGGMENNVHAHAVITATVINAVAHV